VLFLELGYPIRALIQAPLNLQFASPLFWKILLVGAYSLVLVLVLARISTSPSRAATPWVPLLATLLVILALLITLVAGSVYGMMAMRPLWFGGEIPSCS
jgi:formate-dependent nitrite reductase membrane component NrfD